MHRYFSLVDQSLELPMRSTMEMTGKEEIESNSLSVGRDFLRFRALAEPSELYDS